MCELPAERIRLDEVDELLLPVDLDDRDQLAVPSLELGNAADVDLFELESQLVAKLGDRRPRTLAEVAVLRVVETDYG